MPVAPSTLGSSARPSVLFPVAPAICCVTIFAGVVLILVVPPRVRARRIEAATAARGERATWLGYSFYGQCQIIARLAYPSELPPASPEMRLPPDGIGVLLRVDNSRGTRPIEIAPAASRFTLFNGTSLPVDERFQKAPQALRTIPAGSDPERFLLVFDRRAVCERLERIYALQLFVDGAPHHIAGQYYTRVSQARRDQAKLQKRIQLFPEGASPAP